jgi:hypothetical protein
VQIPLFHAPFFYFSIFAKNRISEDDSVCFSACDHPFSLCLPSSRSRPFLFPSKIELASAADSWHPARHMLQLCTENALAIGEVDAPASRVRWRCRRRCRTAHEGHGRRDRQQVQGLTMPLPWPWVRVRHRRAAAGPLRAFPPINARVGQARGLSANRRTSPPPPRCLLRAHHSLAVEAVVGGRHSELGVACRCVEPRHGDRRKRK